MTKFRIKTVYRVFPTCNLNGLIEERQSSSDKILWNHLSAHRIRFLFTRCNLWCNSRRFLQTQTHQNVPVYRWNLKAEIKTVFEEGRDEITRERGTFHRISKNTRLLPIILRNFHPRKTNKVPFGVFRLSQAFSQPTEELNQTDGISVTSSELIISKVHDTKERYSILTQIEASSIGWAKVNASNQRANCRYLSLEHAKTLYRKQVRRFVQCHQFPHFLKGRISLTEYENSQHHYRLRP